MHDNPIGQANNSFCKFPTSDDVENIIDLVLGEINNDDKRNLLEQEIYKLFISQCKNIKEFIWQNSQPLSLFPGASTCFSLLHELRIEANFVSSDALHEMAQICKDLNTLIISNPTLPELFSLIDAQRNLKILKIYNSYNKKGSNKELGEALIRKGNTLKCLHLRPVGTIPPSFLTSLINITEISISSDGIHKDKEIHKYLSISEFPNLEILKVDRLSCFEELASLIEKTKGNISCVCITTVNKSAKNTDMLIKAIANNCPNIKYLYTYLIPQDFIHVKSLLLNCCFLEKLAFDSINFFANKNDNIGDELLDILTKFSPKSLKDIAITEKWKFSTISLENFFKKRLLYSFDIIFDSCNHDQHYFTANHEYMVMKYILEGVISQSNCDYSFLYN
ncbi:hypothetical protein C1645_806539 [Glomus cerebriforme]|uniref:F-box domain-containing protein n=1 Tax=Glomus cerebriforme TaxID=658196 RepID=A0A397SRV8_9GLOM|nr:hypothetical protein C1645_806539 [Glomus cerebriforme]